MGDRFRIGVVGLVHETNTFAPGISEMDLFQPYHTEGYEEFYAKHEGNRTPPGGAIEGAKLHNVELIPGFYTESRPSGMVSAATIEILINQVVQSIPEQLDGLLVILHGAMVSERYMDVELEILTRIRARFSNALPIAIVLDLHANISEELVQLTDVLVGYKTYPHVDTFETSINAMNLLIGMIQGVIKPCLHWGHTRMLVVPQAMITDEGAMSELVGRALEMERDPNVLNVTVAGGFPYSDIPDAGMSFVVTTNGNRNAAAILTSELCTMAWERRKRFNVEEYTVEEAIQRSLKTEDGPDILIEGSDNVGGGAPADATHTLKHLLQIKHSSLMVIRDVKAVQQAHELGVGAILDCAIGGHSDSLHGEPVKIKGRIRLLSDGIYFHVGRYMTGKRVDMGKTAVVITGNVTIILTEYRSPPYDVAQINSVGLNPNDFKMIVVKSAVAWKTAFGEVAKQEIYLDTPGACSANLHHFKYNHVKRPIYPLDHK